MSQYFISKDTDNNKVESFLWDTEETH